MPRPMGWDFGLEKSDLCFKRKFRWLFKIDEISAMGADSLPPLRASRPSITFKEQEVQHLTETVYYPMKPEYKPINLTLYDIKHGSKNPIFNWLKRLFSPEDNANWQAPVKPAGSQDPFIFNEATLELYDGCGEVVELWVYESVWPQSCEFGELEMATSDVLTVDLTLRYARSYIKTNPNPDQGNDGDLVVGKAFIP